MIGNPATLCNTFGRVDFIRVPFPAARTTIWRSDMRQGTRETGNLDYRLSARLRSQWTASLDAGDGRRLERRAKRFVVAKRLEIGVASGKPAVLGVHGYRALQVGHGLGVLTTLSVSDCQHVQGVIVVGILVTHQPEVRNGLVVFAAVDGERRGVKTLLHRPG